MAGKSNPVNKAVRTLNSLAQQPDSELIGRALANTYGVINGYRMMDYYMLLLSELYSARQFITHFAPTQHDKSHMQKGINSIYNKLETLSIGNQMVSLKPTILENLSDIRTHGNMLGMFAPESNSLSFKEGEVEELKATLKELDEALNNVELPPMYIYQIRLIISHIRNDLNRINQVDSSDLLEDWERLIMMFAKVSNIAEARKDTENYKNISNIAILIISITKFLAAGAGATNDFVQLPQSLMTIEAKVIEYSHVVGITRELPSSERTEDHKPEKK